MNPDGCRSLHALMAFLNAALSVSRDEPFATPSIVNSPDAFGSGNCATPLSRMHAANLIAFSRLVAVLLPPPLLPVPVLVLPFSAEPLEQPATISAMMARAASRRGALVTAASLDRAQRRRTWQGSRDRRLGGAARSATV